MSSVETIESSQNSNVKRARQLLRSRKARNEERAFVIEGLNNVDMLLAGQQGRVEAELLMLSESLAGSPDGKDLLARAKTMRRLILKDELMGSIQDVRNGPGVLAIARIPPPPPLPGEGGGKYILLDNLGDPGNMGTIIRSAAGLGINGVLLYGNCVDIYNPKCVRSTAGMLPFIDIAEIEKHDVVQLVDKAYSLVLAEAGSGISLAQWSPADRTIAVIGSEAHGISPEIRTLGSESVHIALAPFCESLNAAVAAGIVMAAMSRLREQD